MAVGRNGDKMDARFAERATTRPPISVVNPAAGDRTEWSVPLLWTSPLVWILALCREGEKLDKISQNLISWLFHKDILDMVVWIYYFEYNHE